jgi:hypothetical protein
MADRDCCPPGTTAPCSGEGSGVDLSTLDTLCCVAAPAPSSSAAVDASRTTHVQPNADDSPDPIAAFAWLATLSSTRESRPLTPPDAVIVRTDAALTYLHTLRLRL